MLSHLAAPPVSNHDGSGTGRETPTGRAAVLRRDQCGPGLAGRTAPLVRQSFRRISGSGPQRGHQRRMFVQHRQQGVHPLGIRQVTPMPEQTFSIPEGQPSIHLMDFESE